MLCGIGVCGVCVDTGGDGDWSVQACREAEDGFPSWHKDGQVSQVSVCVRGERGEEREGGGGGGGGREGGRVYTGDTTM